MIKQDKLDKTQSGRPSHKPTQELRRLVELHTAVGTPSEILARIIGIDAKTMREHYRDELDMAFAQANAKIAGKLFNKALSGDTACMIFWLKTRAGWRETNRTELTGKDGEAIQIDDVSAEEGKRRLAALIAATPAKAVD